MSDSPCARALAVLDQLELFIRAEREHARIADSGKELHPREPHFLELARRALATCNRGQLAELLEEFRGTGHYFGAYVVDQRRLTYFLERLHVAARDAYVAMAKEA